jgi:hypothetical protein
VQVARLSPTVIVKYGDNVHVNDAKALEYVSTHTSIPVPRVFANYTYGPIDRDEEPSGFDTYIFMEYLEGQSLDKEWNNLDDKAKSTVMDELKDYLSQFRAIPSSGYIGSLDHGPVMDNILQYHSAKGTELKPILMKIITKYPNRSICVRELF